MSPRMVAEAVEVARTVLCKHVVHGDRYLLADALLTVMEWHVQAQSDLATLQRRYDQAIHQLEMMATEGQERPQ